MRRHAVISEFKRWVSEQHRAVPRSCAVYTVLQLATRTVGCHLSVTPCLPRYGSRLTTGY